MSDAMKALMSYQQADEEGIMVLVSRQAIHEVADLHDAVKAESERLREDIRYISQDDLHNRLTPRIADVAYTAFRIAKSANADDGGPTDWFNDTKPVVMEMIAKIAALSNQPTDSGEE